jgi:two-component sensor histidine kinase
VQLGRYYLYKRGKFEDALDSAIKILNQASRLSDALHDPDWQSKTQAMIAVYYGYKDPERARQIFQHIIPRFHQKGDSQREADAWEWLGKLYEKSDDHQQQIDYFQHARLLYLNNHQPLKAAEILSMIADVRITHKRFDLAEIDLRELLAEYKAAGKSLVPTYLQLYQLEYNRGNYYRALNYCLLGLKIRPVGDDTFLTVYLYAGAGICNDAVQKHEEAVRWLRKAISIKKTDVRILNSFKFILIKNLIALNRTEEALIALNDISNNKAAKLDTLNLYSVKALYYDKINNNDQAIRYYLKALHAVNDLRRSYTYIDSWAVNFNNGIAAVYLKTNRIAEANIYIKKASLIIKNSKVTLGPPLLVNHYDNLYKYDVATGNYRDAVKNIEHRIKLQDSLFTADKDKQLAELNIQYETAQQEQSIKNLHNQNTIQKAGLEKANIQRNITVGGTLVMLVVSSLIYWNYRQKQAANRIITHKNELLQHLLTQKEWLLKEVHHRVKNNLHTVICLLESQAAYLENDALEAIESSQNRIYAMSLIHQKLYQSDDIKTIDMSEYIPELIRSLQDGFGTTNKKLIEFRLNIEPINLEISHAIPLGLIINEAATNSIKYAFPGNKQGEISISMIRVGKTLKLELADNGIGMPPVDLEKEPESLGLQLMKGLSDDMDADIRFTSNEGTQIIIIFKLEVLNAPENVWKSDAFKETYV